MPSRTASPSARPAALTTVPSSSFSPSPSKSPTTVLPLLSPFSPETPPPSASSHTPLSDGGGSNNNNNNMQFYAMSPYPQPMAYGHHAHGFGSPRPTSPSPSSTFSSSTFLPSSSSLSQASSSGWIPYPHAYPAPPPPPPSTLAAYSTAQGSLGFDFDPALSDTTLSPSKKSKLTAQPPRPPNAWILYRSEKLKAIANQEHIPGLEAIMAEFGMSESSSAHSAEDESGIEDGSGRVAGALALCTKKGKARAMGVAAEETEEMGPPPVPTPSTKRKIKKGAKEPSAGMLSLGTGKGGRGIPQADISRLISSLWKRESPEVRARYEQMSEARKQEHQRLYPDYKFAPMRRADKLKLREEREREKRALRQLKELEKSSNKGANRKTKAKSKASQDMARSETLEYDGRTQHDWSATSYSSTNPVTPAQELRSYPFPMPMQSLPSMKPEDHSNRPFDGPVPFNSSSAPDPLRLSQYTPESTDTPAHTAHGTSSSHLPPTPAPTSREKSSPAQPPPHYPPHPAHGQPMAQSHPYQADWSTFSYPVSVPPDPSEAHQLSYTPLDSSQMFDPYGRGGLSVPGHAMTGTVWAMPISFDLLDADGNPMVPTSGAEHMPASEESPNGLAAIWCDVEGVVDDASDAAAQGVPGGEAESSDEAAMEANRKKDKKGKGKGRRKHGRELAPLKATRGMFSEIPLSSPAGKRFKDDLRDPVPSDLSREAPIGEEDSDEPVHLALGADVSAEQSSAGSAQPQNADGLLQPGLDFYFPPELFDPHSLVSIPFTFAPPGATASYAPTDVSAYPMQYNLDGVVYQLDHPLPDAPTSASAETDHPLGPSLSTQVLSPLDATFPPDSRRPSVHAPRYVSSSAYPTSPGPGPVGGINERQASFSNWTGFGEVGAGGGGAGTGGGAGWDGMDMLQWDEAMSRVASPMGPVAPPAQSVSGPQGVRAAEADTPAAKVPRASAAGGAAARGGRRARAVARGYKPAGTAAASEE